MNAHDKFDHLKLMVIERICAEGFKKHGNSMTKSTEIMKVLVNIQKYKGGTELHTEMLVNLGVFPLTETCLKAYDLGATRQWHEYPATTRLPSILSRAQVNEYEINADETSPEEYFALKLEPDLQNLFRWMKETTNQEALIDSLLTPFRFFFSTLRIRISWLFAS